MKRKSLITQEDKELINRKNCFDFIRYYLALVIIFVHFSVLSEKLEFNWITNGGEAVSGFFTLSGFLIFYSFLKRPELKNYVSKRLRRILPPYFFIVITCAAAGILVTGLTAKEYLLSGQLYKYLLSNLCFMNFLEPCLPGVFTGNIIPAVNGSLWTMKVELMLYATVPITYYLFKRYNKAAVLITIFALSIIYKYTFLHLFDTTGNELYRIMSRQVGTQLIYFYSGTALLFCFSKFQKHIKLILPSTLIVYAAQQYIPFYEYIAPFIFSIIIIGIAYNFKFLNIFNRLPNISYSIYLFHFPVIQTILNFRIHEINPYLALFLSIVLTIVLAYFSYKYVEKPFMSRTAKDKAA